MISNSPEVLNFNWLFLNLNRFICNYLPVLPNHCLRHLNGWLNLFWTVFDSLVRCWLGFIEPKRVTGEKFDGQLMLRGSLLIETTGFFLVASDNMIQVTSNWSQSKCISNAYGSKYHSKYSGRCSFIHMFFDITAVMHIYEYRIAVSFKSVRVDCQLLLPHLLLCYVWREYLFRLLSSRWFFGTTRHLRSSSCKSICWGCFGAFCLFVFLKCNGHSPKRILGIVG